MSSSVQILHVDDDDDFGRLVADLLESENERFDVVNETNVSAALERVEADPPDCIVSDYEMPDGDGVAFLEAVREDHPRLPFVLFTGKGSESIASEAISAGATDYLQKGSGSDQFTLLANRITNAVEQHRARRELERERSRMTFALEATDAAVWTRDVETDDMEISPSICPVFDAEIASLDEWLAHVHPEDRAVAERTIRSAARAADSYSFQFRFPGDDGTRWGEMHGRTVTEDGEVVIQTGITRDITEQKQQKRRFETLAVTLPGMVYRCRNEPGWPMDDVRGNVAELSGYTAAAVESGRVSWGEDVIHPDDRAGAWETVQEALEAGEPFELTYRIETKEGDIAWVRERGRGVFGPDGDVEALEGFITDVTDQRERERELRRSERRFESLFHDPNILVGLLETDGTVLNVNDTAMAYVDVDRETVIGEPFSETPWWSPETREDLEDWIARATAGEYVEFEVEHALSDGDSLFVDGTVRPVTDEAGEVVSLVVSARDVTERKRREAELRRFRERMEFALERTDAVIWQQHPETGEIDTYPDPCPVVEGTVDSVEAFLRQVAPEDRDAVRAALRAVHETGEPRTVEYRTAETAHADWIESRIHPLSKDDGGDGLIGISRDISADKRRERRLERQNEQFDELARIVSHDLQAPISAVRGRLQLATETGDMDHVEDALDAIERLDTRRNALVEMLRSREVVGETEPVDVGTLAERAWEGVTAGDDAELEVADAPTMTGDPQAVERLLQNLLSNAVEHGGTDVTVRVGPLSDGFYVEDDGPGIAPADRDEVFAPGFTTKDDGTGMGMASAAGIVDEHGWDIAVADAEALDGARFEVTT